MYPDRHQNNTNPQRWDALPLVDYGIPNTVQYVNSWPSGPPQIRLQYRACAVPCTVYAAATYVGTSGQIKIDSNNR
jgi:hypothetical protein